MFQPRNTLVLVKTFPRKDEVVGRITVPNANNEYTEAEVIRVGPGTVSADGGRSETFDLKPGMKVWVKDKGRRRSEHGPILVDEGLLLREDGQDMYLFEQSSIVAIMD